MYDEVLLGELHNYAAQNPLFHVLRRKQCPSQYFIIAPVLVFVAIEVWTHLWYKQRSGGKKKPRKEEKRKKKNLPTGVNC